VGVRHSLRNGSLGPASPLAYIVGAGTGYWEREGAGRAIFFPSSDMLTIRALAVGTDQPECFRFCKRCDLAKDGLDNGARVIALVNDVGQSAMRR